MHNVLITGGSGLLGINWAYLISKHSSVHLALNNQVISPSFACPLRLSLDTPTEIARKLSELNIDLVLHAAAIADVERCEQNPAKAYFVNSTLAGNVALACAQVGARMIHISTDQLFNGNDSFYAEDDQPTPVNTYAKSKYESELRVLDSLPTALVIRSNFFGWGTSYRSSFSDYILNTVRKQDSISLADDVYYTPVLISELVRSAMCLISHGCSGIYNISSESRVSKYQFGRLLLREFGIELNKVIPFRSDDSTIAAKVPRPRDMSLSNQKARAIIGSPIGSVEHHLSLLRSQGTARKKFLSL